MARRRRKRSSRCKVVTTCKRPRRRVRICWAKDGRITSTKKVGGTTRRRRRRKSGTTKRRRRSTKSLFVRVSRAKATTKSGKLRKGCTIVRGSGYMCRRGRGKKRRRTAGRTRTRRGGCRYGRVTRGARKGRCRLRPKR